MFELIMFWIWVTVFVYMLVIVPYTIIGALFDWWFTARLDKTILSFTTKATVMKKVRTVAYFPFRIFDKFSDQTAITTGVIIAMTGVVWWIGVIVFQTSESAIGLVPDMIRITSTLAAQLAHYTSWLAPIVVVVVSANFLFTKIVNGFAAIKDKLDLLGD